MVAPTNKQPGWRSAARAEQRRLKTVVAVPTATLSTDSPEARIEARKERTLATLAPKVVKGILKQRAEVEAALAAGPPPPKVVRFRLGPALKRVRTFKKYPIDCWEERRDRYDKDDAAGRRCNVDGYDLFYGSDFEEDSDDEW
ncbi:MAG: hypothetical protein L6R39_001134 [Caloplaca ligustica]|nr:MAG: hypothetical protein L6R39_001134 [Caloplaca ligustica]